jgi:hypothetical protein
MKRRTARAQASRLRKATRRGAPPVVGKCPTCGTEFRSAYEAKQHAIYATHEEPPEA